MTHLTQLLGLSHVSLEQIEVTSGLIILSLAMDTTEASCPLCGKPASRVHSRYQRTLQDLACVGKRLRLLVQVRRFFCANTACARQIFAERLPDLAGVYARRTTRCLTALAELGLALGGRAGAHLSGSLGLTSSRMTILRMLRRTPHPAPSTPRILGVDDWAWRRGKTYGTILVDLERSTPVDLLPDRHAATFATWVRQHPGILLISRDRAGEDANGATQGTPEAIQSADRLHVVRNLAETMERVLHQHRKALKQIQVVAPTASVPSSLLRYPRPDRERQKPRARTALVERYEAGKPSRQARALASCHRSATAHASGVGDSLCQSRTFPRTA